MFRYELTIFRERNVRGFKPVASDKSAVLSVVDTVYL
jgi:hypothetical protein